MSQLIIDPASDPLTLFLVQVLIIIALTRLLGRLLRRLKQPSVIAEIIAGVLLGPTGFGNIPGFTKYVLPDKSLTTLSVFANMGLVLFMFFLGLEVDPAAMARTWRRTTPVAVGGLAIAWISGGIVSLWLYNIEPVHTSKKTFFVFTATAFSFTALPVLGRILAAGKLIATPLGAEALAIASIDDVLAWLTLAVVLATSHGGSPLIGLYTMLISAAFILFLLFPVRKLNIYILARLERKGKTFSRAFTAFVLLSLSLSALFADIIGIHAFFGAFIYGIFLPRGHYLEIIAPKIELLVVEFFLPLYFANSGIRTDLRSLDGKCWGIFVVVLVVACAGQMIPTTLGTYFMSRCQASWKHCLSIGFCINTRGLIALIVLNIGLSDGIFGVKVFSIMVMMALVTTFMTSPALYLLNKPPKVQVEREESTSVPPVPEKTALEMLAGMPKQLVENVMDMIESDHDPYLLAGKKHGLRPERGVTHDEHDLGQNDQDEIAQVVIHSEVHSDDYKDEHKLQKVEESDLDDHNRAHDRNHEIDRDMDDQDLAGKAPPSD